MSQKEGSPSKANRKTFFNEIAKDWDKLSPEKSIAEFLKTIVHDFNIKNGQNVLDIGTGTGVLVPILVQAVGRPGNVVAVDFAEKMVEQSRRKYHSFANVKIELQDVEELNFPEDYFDLITCFGVFPHVEDKKKALLSMYRVLKPKGRLIIVHALSSREIREIHGKSSAAIANDALP